MLRIQKLEYMSVFIHVASGYFQMILKKMSILTEFLATMMEIWER